MWAEKRFDEDGASLSLGSQIVVAETSSDADGCEQSRPLSLPVDHRELEIRFLDDLVSPACHVRVSVEHPAADVSPERFNHDEKE